MIKLTEPLDPVMHPSRGRLRRRGGVHARSGVLHLFQFYHGPIVIFLAVATFVADYLDRARI
jgi:hypothetical protein